MSVPSLVVSRLILAPANAGKHKLRGLVLDPAGQGVERIVFIYEQKRGTKTIALDPPRQFKAAVRSRPDTGEWEINYIGGSGLYTIIVHDSKGEHDPVMKSNLKPEPME